jgi:hypothetical protein
MRRAAADLFAVLDSTQRHTAAWQLPFYGLPQAASLKANSANGIEQEATAMADLVQEVELQRRSRLVGR